MTTYTQTSRPMRIKTALGEDALLLDGFSGVEKVSSPYGFTLDLLSEDPAIVAEDLIATPVVLSLQLPDGESRVFHGLVRRFAQLGQRDDMTAYRAEIVPWLWFLSLSRNIRIFQQMSVLDILEKVFKDRGHTDFKVKCTRSYPVREYCVQYRETDLDFVSRLMEEEGIHYYFEHSDSKHELVLADDSTLNPTCPSFATARMGPEDVKDEDVVHSIEDSRAAFLGSVSLTDYDYLQPSLSLDISASGKGTGEVYDYPGKYSKPEDGERYALLRLQSGEATQRVVTGTGTCRGFVAGHKFTLKDHYRKDVNQAYLLVEVRHRGQAGGYRSWSRGEEEYRNEFVCIPAATPYRPAPRTPRPVVHGSQTAVVVGKKGEEIWVDKHGRVKVQFYWDREGKADENSSCWVRVSSSWAGKGWGWIQIPRIGQEVIVDFLEGDPDRPIITGRVYNAEQVPPYDLPANQTQSGVKSRSSKGGSTDAFNELRFDDKKDSELVYFHAQKDMEVVVENDRTETVGNDETVSIGHDQSLSVGNDQTEDVGANKTVTVGKDEKITISGGRTESIAKDMKLSVTGNADITIGKDVTEAVKGSSSQQIGKDSAVSVGKNHGLDVGKQVSIKAGDAITLQSDKEIVIKAGQASIQLKKNGDIVIKGGKIQVKGSKDLVLKGSKIAAN
jgi:type VI secretion system secreted protein VgrG